MNLSAISNTTAPIFESESTVIVYFSTQTDRFKFITGNRQLDEFKIKRMVEDIEGGLDLLKYFPVLVWEDEHGTLWIIDGQHRFYVSRKLKRPIFYIKITKELALGQIAKCNSNQSGWKTTDYIQCYINTGIQDYQELKQFVETYKLNVTISIKLLTKGYPGSSTGGGREFTDPFKRGEFRVKHKEEAVAIAESVKLFNSFKDSRTSEFVIAIHKIMKAGKVQIPDLVSKYTKNKDKLVKQKTWKDYIINLESIYNAGKVERVTLIDEFR